MKYFAYGSNMHVPHLLKQIPDATVLGIAKLKGYQLFFHKLGHDDGSGKCNIIPVRHGSHEVYGVLYDIPPRSRSILDRAEKLGYGNQDMTLRVIPVHKSEHEYLENPEGVFAFTYIAHSARVRDNLMPFSWYKNTVILGAREHDLPESYIRELEQYVAIPDPDLNRDSLQQRQLASEFS